VVSRNPIFLSRAVEIFLDNVLFFSATVGRARTWEDYGRSGGPILNECNRLFSSVIAHRLESGIMNDVGFIGDVDTPDCHEIASSTAFRNWAGGK
jgi:hypothetical protein